MKNEQDEEEKKKREEEDKKTKDDGDDGNYYVYFCIQLILGQCFTLYSLADLFNRNHLNFSGKHSAILQVYPMCCGLLTSELCVRPVTLCQ